MPVSSKAWRAGELGTPNLCWPLSWRRRLLTLEPTQSICPESLAGPGVNCNYSVHSLSWIGPTPSILHGLEVLVFATQ